MHFQNDSLVVLSCSGAKSPPSGARDSGAHGSTMVVPLSLAPMFRSWPMGWLRSRAGWRGQYFDLATAGLMEGLAVLNTEYLLLVLSIALDLRFISLFFNKVIFLPEYMKIKIK